MALIYCVEDDKGIRELIKCALGTAGYETKCFERASELFEALCESIPNLILLDIMLPEISGMEILNELKHSKYKDVPVIMITAKTMETDKVAGLDAGAEDYITKPFSILEFLARVKVALRRSKDAQSIANVISVNGLTVDYEKRTVTYKSALVVLTYKEFELLYFLMNNKSIVMTREQLLEKVWGYDYEGESRTVDVHVKTLRRKLELAGCPECIFTVRGAGYKFGE